MLEPYLQLLPASLVLARKDKKRGRPVYQVFYPGGQTDWMTGKAFEEQYRPMSKHERQLLVMTEDEAQVNAIGATSTPPCTGKHGKHEWNYSELDCCWLCVRCGAESAQNPNQAG